MQDCSGFWHLTVTVLTRQEALAAAMAAGGHGGDLPMGAMHGMELMEVSPDRLIAALEMKPPSMTHTYIRA